MPYQIKKNKDGTYRVLNSENKEVKAKQTTKAKAEKQVWLLEFLHNKKK